jgi:hypothetical protein
MRKPKKPNRKQLQQQRKPNDLSHCLAAFDSDHTLIAVVELSLSSWLSAKPSFASGPRDDATG